MFKVNAFLNRHYITSCQVYLKKLPKLKALLNFTFHHFILCSTQQSQADDQRRILQQEHGVQ